SPPPPPSGWRWNAAGSSSRRSRRPALASSRSGTRRIGLRFSSLGTGNTGPGMLRRALLPLVLVLVSAGCGSNRQSTLAPHSKASGEIATLWWSMMIGAWVVFGVVVMLLAVAFLRRRGETPPDDSKAKRLILIGGGIAP